jgi:hypothetical protein
MRVGSGLMSGACEWMVGGQNLTGVTVLSLYSDCKTLLLITIIKIVYYISCVGRTY